jgi:hypothetical protein
LSRHTKQEVLCSDVAVSKLARFLPS